MSALTRRVIFDNDDPHASENGSGMEFYLTYAGPLKATQRDARDGEPSRHVENKRAIRRVFHGQLKKLWEVLPALNGSDNRRPAFRVASGERSPKTIESLGAAHSMYGRNFVPLVTQELDLLCNIDIIMLRPDRPGSVIWAGDIDNRLKTLLDALRIPDAGEGYADSEPAPDETPFFVLLQDDKLITKVTVETDRLLEPVQVPLRQEDVRLFIRLTIKPYALHPDNMHFG